MVQCSPANSAMRSSSIFSGASARVNPSRAASRLTCVSTTTPSFTPNALPRMTFAVLRPTPGSADSSASVRGTSPPWSAISPRANPMTLRALFRKKPVERTTSSTSSWAAPASASASGYRAKSTGVTMLTRSSVVWADRIVATPSWNASWYVSSQWASGYSSARRS
jgi:hypothetical protein